MQAVLTPHPPSSLHTYLHHDYHLPHAYSIHNTCIMIRSHALEILIIIPQILKVLSMHTICSIQIIIFIVCIMKVKPPPLPPQYNMGPSKGC